MTDEPQRFKVIQGGPAGDGEAKPKRYRARKRGEPELLTCPRCSSSTVIEAKAGMMLVDQRPRDGSKTLICVHCLAQGRVQVVL